MCPAFGSFSGCLTENDSIVNSAGMPVLFFGDAATCALTPCLRNTNLADGTVGAISNMSIPHSAWPSVFAAGTSSSVA